MRKSFIKGINIILSCTNTVQLNTARNYVDQYGHIYGQNDYYITLKVICNEAISKYSTEF